LGLPPSGFSIVDEDKINTIFPHALSGIGGVVFGVVLLVLSLALIFYGRSIIKGVAFLTVGLVGAAFGLVAGGLVLGFIGAGIGAIVGFVIGGLIGLLIVHVGMGIVLGYFGYLAVRDVTHGSLLAILVGIILFFVGVAISIKLLELVTAIVGGVILYNVLVFFGVPALYAVVVAVALAAIGFYVQQQQQKRRLRRINNWKQL
jgi:hypothetical protein